MVNNTVNHIGKAAGKADKTITTVMQATQKENELEILGKTGRKNEQNEYISIKAYPGGNPNKVKNNEERA